MNIITQGTNNYFYCTVTEKQTLSNPYFLFEFTPRSGAAKRFIAFDSSQFTTRFNKFLITESTSEVLTSGTVNLAEDGEYKYRVWEQTSSTNINPDLATNLLEVGMLRVNSSTADFTFTSNGGNFTFE